MLPTLASAPQDLQLLKLYLLDLTGLSKDALHVYAGMILIIGVRLVWRRRGGWLLGWLLALGVALLVEWLDMRAERIEANIRPDAEHWKDIWNTMFWPTVLLLFGRWLHPRPKPKTLAMEDPSGDLPDQSPHDSGEESPSI
ncbi:hypothetical protein [Sphingorhabdus sp.]|jgi:hypothetical protein|uniref:hypothetical protein n=1 Tax=Sphingorhabdus sp. TaxID=1902408 RepID=UPI003BAF79B2|nr:hypothetical protein [Sphingomonadales bacterium]MBK9432072.1 hypothetical protein [Sphingomonadales bacterium]MBL0023401.1 hypothetical protein [Sphingomonadales bacterium]